MIVYVVKLYGSLCGFFSTEEKALEYNKTLLIAEEIPENEWDSYLDVEEWRVDDG